MNKTMLQSVFHLLVCWGILLLALSCNKLDKTSEDVDEKDLVLEKTTGVKLIYSDSGSVRVQLQSPVMLRHLENATPWEEFTKGIEVDFFDGNQEVESHLSARYAKREPLKKQLIVQDSIVWTNNRKEKLETSELVWDEINRKMYSNKFSKISRPGEIIYGYQFETDQDFRRWKIKAMEGRIKIDGAQ